MTNLRHSAYLTVRLAIGGLFLTAGITKLFPLQAVMLTPTIEISSAIVAALAACEIGLGWLTLRGSRSKVAYYLTGTLLIVFIAVLLLRWLRGASSCPCIASLEVPIVLMILADVGCLGSLVATRQKWLSSDSDDHIISEVSRGLAFAIPSVLIVVAMYFGSLGSFLVWSSGNQIVAENHRSYLGKVAVGESKDISFRVTNYSSNSVTIVGAKTSCSCTAFKDLPIELAPGASNSIRVTVTGRSQDVNRFRSYMAFLLCDQPGGNVTLRIDGAVVPSS